MCITNITLEKQMKVDYKKIILSTTLWTLTAIIVLSAIFVCIMIFAFPKNLGDFFYSLGSNNLASGLYMRVYEKDNDIYYCYKSLNLVIKQDNSKKIVSIYETFTKDEDYEHFMSELKKRNEQLDIGVLEKSSILNEDDYLKNRYIRALIKTKDEQKAYAIAIESFENYKDSTFHNQGVYALNYFLDMEGFNNFDVEPANYDKTLIESMKEYFELSVNLFNENKDTSDNLEKAYLISLGNRVIQVGQNINEICSDDASLIASNNQKMQDINDCIKGIL